MRFVFDGNTFTIKHPPGPQPFENGREERSFFRLDPTKKAKQIHMSDAARGIYELEGDTLKLCWDQHAKTNGRPIRFSLRQEKESAHCFVLKREKKKVQPGTEKLQGKRGVLSGR
jgi:uncharacterized protein (TIGR03067 family)